MANNKKQCKAIIFDLGGVYFQSGLNAFLALSEEEGFKYNKFLNILKRKYLKKIETSKLSEKEFWHRFKTDVGFKQTIAEVKNSFLTAHKPMPGMQELVKRLRKKYKVGLLTNNVSEWYKRIDHHFKVGKNFDAVVVSADVATRKPNRKIYLLMANQLGVKPQECIFFDDFYENIAGAKKAGMEAYKFQSTQEVEEKLTKVGILPPINPGRVPKKQVVSLRVNDQEIKTEKGNSLLKALGENGFSVPTLCYAPIFPPQANCRICLVEVKGARNLATACSTEAKNGMEVYTDTEKVEKARQTNLKLLYQDHIGKCPTCVRLKNCELLKLVSKYKAGAPDFKGKERKFKIDKSGVVVFDMNKCIKCRRCIEACKKHGSDVLEIKGRAFNSVAGTKNGKRLKDSGCIGCKQCAAVCPVGAIYINEK